MARSPWRASCPGSGASRPTRARAVARRFNLLAWPTFALVVATGIWNVLAIDPDWGSSYGTTLIVKIVVVVISGVSAFLHTRVKSRRGLAVFGALSGLSAVAALFLGIMLG